MTVKNTIVGLCVHNDLMIRFTVADFADAIDADVVFVIGFEAALGC